MKKGKGDVKKYYQPGKNLMQIKIVECASSQKNVFS